MSGYVQSREGRGRTEVKVKGCRCSEPPLVVNVKEGKTVLRSYCARCEQDITVSRSGGSGPGIRIPFGALVEKDRPWQPRDPNEKY